MDKFMSVAKGGWHPEKERANSGSSSGTHTDSKLGQVKGWVGKGGKDTHAEAARDHQSTPLTSLKDPSTFAPPPKRVNYDGGSAASSSTGLSSAPAGSAKQRLQEREEARRREEEQAAKPAPGPYRTDTTGIDTSNLPKPPAFRPPPPLPPSSKPKPGLPPRPPLPPRQNSNPNEYAQPPPPTYNEATQGTPSQGVLNQGALNRLGSAGVSVPGFGIGRTASPPVPPRANPSPPVPPRQNSASNASTPPPVAAGTGSQMSELQSRFAKMSGPKSPAAAPTEGTSWADKQAALRTASSLRNDPSKVSASDLKATAATANNFHQRHGDQVAAGWKSANSLNQKYGIAGKLNSFASSSAAPASSATPQPPTPGSPGVSGKKPPPPPPPKRKELTSDGTGEPPPIPLASKPKF